MGRGPVGRLTHKGQHPSGVPWQRAGAPEGTGAALLTAPGHDGAGVPFADVERGWALHADLPPLVLPQADTDGTHGTKTLGVVLARPADGVRLGMAPAAGPVWLFATTDANGDGCADDIAARLADAAAELGPGAVLLIEETTRGWADPNAPLLPPEADPRVFEAIRVLTARGVTVIEPAGNSALELDTLPDTVRWQPRRDAADFVDSGAVVVGAGHYTCLERDEQKVHQTWIPSRVTNRGSRLDCFADGTRIYATSRAGTEDTLDSYTDTSAASAVVAGAAVVVQAMAKAATGSFLSPVELRALLTRRATPGANGIGAMPDLVQAQSALTNAADLYLLDGPEDRYDHRSRSSCSPDILPSPTRVAPPLAFVGTLDPGAPLYVYLHVRAARAPGIVSRVSLYWSEASTLVLGDRWRLLREVSPNTNVPMDGVTLIPLLSTTPVAERTGAHVWITTVEGPTDRAPHPSELVHPDAWAWHLAHTNNIAVLAHNRAEPSRGQHKQYTLRCLVRGAWVTTEMALEARCALAPGSSAHLDLPAELAAGLGVVAGPGDVDLPTTTDVRVALPFHGAWLRLGEGTIVALREHLVTVHVCVPLGLAGGVVALRQVYRGVEVGRYTWELVP